MIKKTILAAVSAVALLSGAAAQADDRADYNRVANQTERCALAARTMKKAEPCRTIMADYLRQSGQDATVAEANAISFILETLGEHNLIPKLPDSRPSYFDR
jgi:hypothetical protein